MLGQRLVLNRLHVGRPYTAKHPNSPSGLGTFQPGVRMPRFIQRTRILVARRNAGDSRAAWNPLAALFPSKRDRKLPQVFRPNWEHLEERACPAVVTIPLDFESPSTGSVPHVTTSFGSVELTGFY